MNKNYHKYKKYKHKYNLIKIGGSPIVEVSIYQSTGQMDKVSVELPCTVASFRKTCKVKNLLTDYNYRLFLKGQEEHLKTYDMLTVENNILFAIPFHGKPIKKYGLLKKLVRKVCNGTFSEEDISNYGNISTWDVSQITDMTNLFKDEKDFNEDINEWDVSNVRSMSNMFSGASKFNQPLNEWDVSNVDNMSFMFRDAINFNQPLNKWDVSKVMNMSLMFSWASNFNQPLNKWDVSKVEDLDNMFYGTSNFQYINDNCNHFMDTSKKSKTQVKQYTDCVKIQLKRKSR